MSRTLVLGAVATVALAALAGAATAQQSAPPAVERQAHAPRADTDGDGRISQAEFVGRRIARLTAADADRDGSVTRQEMQARRGAHMQQRAEARFARLDVNADGAISREEFTAPRAARAEAGRHGPRGARHDGPRAERGPVSVAEAQTKAEQAFARLDADRDGFVTAEERRAGMQQARERRRERMAERRAARQASRPAPASE